MIVPGKRPQANSDPEMDFVVRDKVEQGREHGAKKRPVEGVYPTIYHGGGV